MYVNTHFEPSRSDNQLVRNSEIQEPYDFSRFSPKGPEFLEGEYFPITKAAVKINLVLGKRTIINKPGTSSPKTEVAL